MRPSPLSPLHGDYEAATEMQSSITLTVLRERAFHFEFPFSVLGIVTLIKVYGNFKLL